MKKVLITICTPTRNNYRAASALPFHLILGDLHNAKSDEAKVDYIIYSFNSNRLSSEQIRGVECELGAKNRHYRETQVAAMDVQTTFGVLKDSVSLSFDGLSVITR